MRLIPDPRISRECLERVSLLLSTYRCEEVQAALNHLVEDSKWLEKHRQETCTEQKRIAVQTASQRSQELLGLTALSIYRETSD